MTVPNLVVCPKCRRERKSGEDSCARCGLLVTRWSGFVAAPPPSSQTSPAPGQTSLTPGSTSPAPGQASLTPAQPEVAWTLFAAQATAERERRRLAQERLLRLLSIVVALVAFAVTFWLFRKHP